MPEYYKAAQFADDATSSAVYGEVRQAIYETPCDMSTYRTMLLPSQEWFVLALGSTPPESLRERIEKSLAQGIAVELPEDIWKAFNQRRLQQTARGGWVETKHRRTR